IVPMRRRAAAVEQPSFRQHEGAGAGGRDSAIAPGCLADEFDEPRRRWLELRAAADDQGIELSIVERVRIHRYADGGAHGPSVLREETHVVHLLLEFKVGELEDRYRREAHDLGAGEGNESDALHGRNPSNVLKRRIYDIQDADLQDYSPPTATPNRKL